MKALSISRILTVPVLKFHAKNHYLAYTRGRDDMSCGKVLAEHISGTLTHHKLAFNSIMDRLAELDPSTPKSRL